MNKFAKFSLFFVLFFSFITTNAQVKQIFKVIEYDSKKPLAGASTTLYGETITTNEKGVAIVNLPEHRKGDYLALNTWNLDGYTDLGRTEESLYKYNQTPDTLKFYLVKDELFKQEFDKFFIALFDKWFDEKYSAYAQPLIDQLKSSRENSLNFANELINFAHSDNYSAVNCFNDAFDANFYELYEYNSPIFKEVIQSLYSGNIDKAIEIAKGKIDKNSTSRENELWINLYRKLHYLNFSPKTDELLSDYSEILYKKYYNPYSTVKYINDLQTDRLFEKLDSVIIAEKDKNNNPQFKDLFIPNAAKCFDEQDLTCIKSVADELVSIDKNNYLKYPCISSVDKLLTAYFISIAAYSELNDSLQVATIFDSACDLLLTNSKIINNIEQRKRFLIQYAVYFANLLEINPTSADQKTVNKLFRSVCDAISESYKNNKTCSVNQIEVSQIGFYFLQFLSPEADNSEVSDYIYEYISLIYEANRQLINKYPALFAPRNASTTANLLETGIISGKDANTLADIFNKYEQSFDDLNAAFPYSFIEKYLSFNATLESYFSINQIFALSTELDNFNEKLFNLSAKDKNVDPNVVRADYNNDIAEYLYNQRGYDVAVPFYLKANELYKSLISRDSTMWIPYLKNYLQMGDAHLYQNQFDKAIATYNKIFEFEPQIPKSLKGIYTALKGSAHYYIGDANKSQNNIKTAEKEYKTAEKEFKKAISLDYPQAYHSLGEMYFSKAVIAAQNDDKKCEQLVAQSVNYYEKCEFDKPYATYEKAKQALIEFNKAYNDSAAIIKNTASFIDYYRNFLHLNPNYAIDLYNYSDYMLRNNKLSYKDYLNYTKDMLNSLIILDDDGRNVDVPYLNTLYKLGNAYIANDSVHEAIKTFRDCFKMNELIYKDTANDVWQYNKTDIYPRLIECYSIMAEKIDTAHSELWNFRIADTRDTLIDVITTFALKGDDNMRYFASNQLRNNAVTYYKLDMLVSAINYLDKSSEMLMPLYNSEYKIKVEEDLMKNYYFKGTMYSENNDSEKAVENFKKAIAIGDKSDNIRNVVDFQFASIESLISELKKGNVANADEIKQLENKMKSLKKLR